MTPRRRVALSGLLVLLLSCTAGHAGWLFSVEAGYDYDDNISRAVFEDDVESAPGFLLVSSGGFRWQLGKNSSLSLRGLLEAAVPDNDQLRHYDFAAIVAYRLKTRVGADAPYVDFGLSLRQQAWESDIRQGSVMEAKFAFGQPVTTLWEYRLQLDYMQRDADSAAFTQDAWALRFHNDLFFTSNGFLTLEYRYRVGEVTSTATNRVLQPETQPLWDIETANIPDDAFFDVFGDPKIAYRIDATTHTFQIAWNQSLGAHHAINIAYQYQLSIADENTDLDYTNNLFRLAYIYRL
jgi:hypothetical protein